MSEPVNVPPGQTIPITCKSCGYLNQFIPPIYEVLNSQSVSMIVFAHPDVQCCAQCNAPHQFVIAEQGMKNIGLPIGFVRVRQQSQIITPSREIILPS